MNTWIEGPLFLMLLKVGLGTLLVVLAMATTSSCDTPPLPPTEEGEAEATPEGASEPEGVLDKEGEGEGETEGNTLLRQDYGYEIVNVYPHDPAAFTQGLLYADGILYEGTGLYGESTLRKVDLETGTLLQIIEMPRRKVGLRQQDLFGEGIALVNSGLFQLSWRAGIAFLYDRETFELKQEFAYKTEGWGLTYDGQSLIMSDGTASLYFRDPVTFELQRRVAVYDGNTAIKRLNELEYIDGVLWANIWQTDRIARIDPATGEVLGWIFLEGLLSAQEAASADVLNGIAYDKENDRLFVTGKRWPKLFEIHLVPYN